MLSHARFAMCYNNSKQTDLSDQVSRNKDTLSMILSIFPSSTDFFIDCAVSATDSVIFFVAAVAKLKR